MFDLKRGEKVEIIGQCSDIWWRGRKENGEEGFFPRSFVRQIVKNAWNESGLVDLYFQSKSVGIPSKDIEYEGFVTVMGFYRDWKRRDKFGSRKLCESCWSV